MRLLMADRTLNRHIRTLYDVLVKVESFIFRNDLMILDCEVDFEVPIILGRPFRAAGQTFVDMYKGHMMFRLKNEETTFNICRSINMKGDIQTVSTISYIIASESKVYIKE